MEPTGGGYRAQALPENTDEPAPVWKHQLHSGNFVAEVFENPNAAHAVVVTHAGALAVLPGRP